MKHFTCTVRFFCVLLPALGGGCSSSRQAVVTGYDAVGHPGDEITLRVKIAENNWRRENIRYAVAFLSLKEGPAPSATSFAIVTDKKGEANIRFVPPVPGFYRFQVTYPDGQQPLGDGGLLLACYDGRRPGLVVDIDGTLTAAKNYFRQKHLPVRDGDTVQVLRRLSGWCDIIYVTGRLRFQAADTRAWLEAKGFPTGPVFLLDPQECRTISSETYKTRLLTDMVKVFPNIVVGIGNRRDDAEAYGKAGLVPFLFDARRMNAIHVTDWREIEKQLMKCRHLPPSEMKRELLKSVSQDSG